MSYFIWEVYWFASTGEECCEQFDSKSEADAFMQYNDWQKNEHPKIREVEIER